MTSGAGDRTTARSPGKFWLLTAFLLLATTGFGALGVWQVHRLAWKLDLIAEIDSRTHAAPAPAPGPAAWPDINASQDAYRRVRVSGEFQNDRETHVLAVTSLGSGYWVITPLHTDQGFTVVVNRGFVPPDRADPSTRPSPPSHVELTGLLRITEPKGGFLRSNDPEADRWYSRDVTAIAEARHLTDVAPYFIDAEAASGPHDETEPVGGLTVINLPNNHLSYALTWFAMALLALAAAAFVVFDHLRHACPMPASTAPTAHRS